MTSKPSDYGQERPKDITASPKLLRLRRGDSPRQTASSERLNLESQVATAATNTDPRPAHCPHPKPSPAHTNDKTYPLFAMTGMSIIPTEGGVVRFRPVPLRPEEPSQAFRRNIFTKLSEFICSE